MSRMALPQLETPHLSLRLMQPDDGDVLLGIFADPQVMAAFAMPPLNREQVMQWLQRNLDHQTAHGYSLFAVVLKTNGVLIGNCGLERMELEGNEVVELGYDFQSAYWNGGYATEAAQAVRTNAFQQLQLPSLVSLIRVGNLPSRRVAEKLGMCCMGELLRHGNHYWKYQIDCDIAIDDTAHNTHSPRGAAYL